jgi:hypothetical protein
MSTKTKKKVPQETLWVRVPKPVLDGIDAYLEDHLRPDEPMATRSRAVRNLIVVGLRKLKLLGDK